MSTILHDPAEIEYAVMLAVLDFQTEFMNSTYTQVHVRTRGGEVEVTLTRTKPIPAEDLLSRSTEGRALLEQVHGALFRSGERLLRNRLERALGVKIRSLSTHLDTVAHTATIHIGVEEHLGSHRRQTKLRGHDLKRTPSRRT